VIKVKKITIDPGHAPGNANRGPTGYYEYAGMWKLANSLKDALERCGIEVKLTRTVNEDPSLSERGNRAKGSDVFISEHSNAANGKVRGVECFYSVRIPGDKIWASKISAAGSKLMGNTDRGAKTRESGTTKGYDYYGVIRSAVASGVPHVFLVESGFHDNVQDEAFLKKDDNLEKLAESQAEVLCELLGVKYIAKDETVSQPSTDLYRVRKSWNDAKSQVGAYRILDNAKAECDKHPGYSVYDEAGNAVYGVAVPTPEPPKQEKPAGTPIISSARATVGQAKVWAKSKGATDIFVSLADIFWRLAPAVGVDPVVAYVQSAKETGYGKFGGVLDESFRNPCGMKKKEGGGDYDKEAHQRFASWEEGIQAQLDHLALYAGAPGYPKATTPDPRHFDFIAGTAKTVESLGSRWAPSATYGNDIVKMMNELIATLEPVAPVEPEHWAEKYYRFLTDEKGIVIHERKFDDTITRGEIYCLMARLLGYKEK
jgi:N-acetylmuramoyl-L-alanine amidase